jgi:hypothetical protein
MGGGSRSPIKRSKGRGALHSQSTTSPQIARFLLARVASPVSSLLLEGQTIPKSVLQRLDDSEAPNVIKQNWSSTGVRNCNKRRINRYVAGVATLNRGQPSNQQEQKHLFSYLGV